MSINCEACPNGRTSNQESGSSSCDPLPAGQFGMGASCPVNTYSESGAIECTTCPSGKYSEIGASQCMECDFMYTLSKHCDVPYLGMILVRVPASLIYYTTMSILSFVSLFISQENHSNRNAQTHNRKLRKLNSRFALEHRYWQL